MKVMTNIPVPPGEQQGTDHAERIRRKGLLPLRFVVGAVVLCTLLAGALFAYLAPEDQGKEARREVEHPVDGSQFHGSGRVYRLLQDGKEEGKNQRFLVRTPEGRSLLISHNTRYAPRLEGLAVGDVVEFCGKFKDNDKGGVVFGTYKDPFGKYPEGWLRRNGRCNEGPLASTNTETGSKEEGNRAFPLPVSDWPVDDSQFHEVGIVTELLPDYKSQRGTTYQQAFVRTRTIPSLHILHNLQHAPRLEGLAVGDVIEFCGKRRMSKGEECLYGTYEDPRGKYPRGWLLYKGKYHY